MSELSIRVRKLQDNGSSFRATPDTLYLGGIRSAKVDTLRFELPEEWASCAVTLHVQRLSGTLPDPQVLDENNCVVVDRRWTLEKQGMWMLLAAGENGYIAMTKPGQYTCYETIDTDSTTETIDPSVYEQFVELVVKSTTEAKDAARNAKADRQAADQILTDTRQAGTDAVMAIGNARQTALDDVESARTGALKDIGNARQGALQDVASATEASAAYARAAAGSAAAADASEKAAAESARKAAASEKNAADSETKAGESAAAAKKSAEEAGARAGTDETVSIKGAPADAAAVRKLIEESLAAQRAEDYARIKFWASPDPTSPAALFGGTWEQIKDRFILAAGDTYAAGSTGGEANHVLTENELPYLRGTIGAHAGANNSLASMWHGADGVFKNSVRWPGYVKPQAAAFTDAASVKIILFEVGNNQPHNNMPPYLTLYMWRRVEDAA